MFEKLDLGFELDAEGVFPGLTAEQKNEWQKSVMYAYFEGPGLILAAFALTALLLFYTKPEDFIVFESPYAVAIIGAWVLLSAYTKRKAILERRKLVWMACAIKWIRE
jgi:hypothetical protein